MNKIEKRALNALRKEEKEKIAGGVKDTDDLSKEQCENLKNAVSALSESEQMQIAGGDFKEPIQNTNEEGTQQKVNDPIEELKSKLLIKDPSAICKVIAYGCPMPSPIIDVPSILKEKEDIKEKQNNNL